MTEVEVCNLALSHIGQGVEIQAMDERGAAAEACNAFFEVARKKILRDFTWPFASKKAQSLALVEEFDTDSNSEWAFSYRYPTDCLYFRKIQNGLRARSPDTDTHYEISHDSEGKLILTDFEDPVGDYTVDHGDTNIWPEDFSVALSYLLAHYIAPRLAKGNIMNLKKEMEQMYMKEAMNSVANAKNEQNLDQDPDPEMIRAR
jgi:hypothetical protein